MQIAIFVYDHVTALEAVGPYEILSRLPGAETVFVGTSRGPVRCDTGSLALVADATLDEVMSPDVVVVPGWSGSTQDTVLRPGAVQGWLRAVDERSTWTTSIGTGSVVMASAGLLDGRRATTHWLALDRLEQHGAVVIPESVVFDGKYVSASGAAAGIDMALTLAARLSDGHTAQAIQLLLAYDPRPPFDSGSVDRAPVDIVDSMRAVRDFIVDGAPAQVLPDS
jgi:putative intracellular protease/amidase